MADSAPGTAPISDNRIAPRGVLPRGTQTWLMVALALGILGIIVFAGHPEPAPRTATSVATPAALAPQPDRLRDYQDRLRALDERARLQAVTEPRPVISQPPYEEPAAQAAPDPVEAERKRREYESLFSSNVVISRRPQADRLTTGNESPGP